MKVLLTAINAKYIHSNLAVYSLRAYALQNQSERLPEIGIAEYTINQPLDQILMDMYKKQPDMICFSCYLWNIEYVKQLITEVPKILPHAEIWLGGPEVTFHSEALLARYSGVRGIMRGEGEQTFLELLEYYSGDKKSLRQIAGITFREPVETELVGMELETDLISGNGVSDVYITEDRPVMDLSKVPFIYKDLKVFQNRIIYYESSRGCPFSCSYCLSSIDKCLRFRNLELVKRELQFFIDHDISQVKFVDRTFNCQHDHAMAIWSYIKEHDKGNTNFHFEVAADLLNEDELELIASMRPGLIQLEIGVQSTNEKTIREIHRVMDFAKVSEIVKKIKSNGNIHQHLDLIAGLPYEDYESFHRSFCHVYALRPEQLQLGFLKVLKGSYMEEKAKDYGLVFQDRPPYEVLSTRWLPYSDVIRLKGVEEMVEVYYNSGQFVNTLERLERAFADAFVMFEALSEYYEKNDLFKVNHTRVARYEILFAFAKEFDEREIEGYREALTYDLYLRENVKNRPAFAGEETISKEEATAFYEAEAQERQYLQGYEQYDKRQMRKMTHLERYQGERILFDYRNRNPLTHQAAVYRTTEDRKAQERVCGNG